MTLLLSALQVVWFSCLSILFSFYFLLLLLSAPSVGCFHLLALVGLWFAWIMFMIAIFKGVQVIYTHIWNTYLHILCTFFTTLGNLSFGNTWLYNNRRLWTVRWDDKKEGNKGKLYTSDTNCFLFNLSHSCL